MSPAASIFPAKVGLLFGSCFYLTDISIRVLLISEGCFYPRNLVNKILITYIYINKKGKRLNFLNYPQKYFFSFVVVNGMIESRVDHSIYNTPKATF